LQLKQHGVRVVASSSHKGRALDQVDLTGSLALVVGNEGAGLPNEILSEADELVTIPHSSRVESLNAGIAAAILLYETSRQRRKNLTTDEH
jgi:tRNA G18 (ribose-2'-O)-methylase SpoU